jgi:hypothetical protein
VKNRPSLPGAYSGSRRRMAEHKLFYRMIARQQIDLLSIQGGSADAAIREALDTCLHCSAKATCAAWPAGKDEPGSYARFCPDTEAIESLRTMTAQKGVPNDEM